MKKMPQMVLEDIFEETCEKNHPDAEVLTIIQGVGTVPREQSGREIIYDKNSLASYKFVKKGDFIIHLRSFEGGLEVANSDGIVSPAYIILHPKIEVSTIYLYALFHTNRFINQTMAPAVEGARDGRSVKYDVLKKQKISFPPIGEQKKIAEILATQDRVIELKEKLIAEKQSQKKYLMSVLLGDDFKKPFKLNGVTIDKKKWEKKKLQNIIKLQGGFAFPSNQFKSYGVPVVRISNIENDEVILRDVVCFDSDGISKEFRLNFGDMVIAMSGATTGKIGVYKYETPSYINQRVGKFIPISKNFDYQFLIQFCKSFSFSNQLKLLLATGAQPNISSNDIENMLLRLPTFLEQKAIAEVLSAADEEISLLQKDLEQEKLKKKSLMQLLLTGLVRAQ